MKDRLDAIRTYAGEVNQQYSILGWVEGPVAEAADLRGVNSILMDLALDREFCCDLMDLCLDVGIEFARAQLEAGADTIGIGDAIASQVSPQIYEELILPREKKLCNFIHEMGALSRLHICGNITHLLPGIEDIGVDILDVDHMVDIARVRQALGSRVCLVGNLDPVSEVYSSSPGRIQEALLRIYNEVGNPYMVAAGCEIPAGTPPENLRSLCKPLIYCT